MTPRAARRTLTIHEPVAGEVTLARRRRFAGAGSITALTGHGSAPAADGDGAHSWLLRRESLSRRLLGLADAVALTLALVVVLAGAHTGHEVLRLVVSASLAIVLFKVVGLYDFDVMRLVHSTLDEAPLLLQGTGVYVLLVMIVSPLLGAGALSAGRIGALWVSSFVATIGGRTVARWLAAKLSPLERCLVIGERDVAERIRAKLASSNARACVIATLSMSGGESEAWGTPEGLRHVATELRLDRVIIAPSSTDAHGLAELVRIAQAAGVRVSVLPRWLEVVGSAVEFDDVDGLTMMGVRPFGLSRSSRALKRVFDIVAGSLALLAVLPLLAAIAVAIRLDSEGPVVFRQVRVGRDGRRFRIFKFRSMVVDAEERKERLRRFNESGAGLFKLSGDPRVTRVGAILRKTSLDELPQLFNVLRGEMSLVGPRPLVTDEDAQVVGLDRRRLLLTPGMTGPWQVLGCRVPMQEMVGIDYLYVANWSLWSDLKLLLRTVRHVLRRGNV